MSDFELDFLAESYMCKYLYMCLCAYTCASTNVYVRCTYFLPEQFCLKLRRIRQLDFSFTVWKDSSKLKRIQLHSHKFFCGSQYDCGSFLQLSVRRTYQAPKCFISMMDTRHNLHHFISKTVQSDASLRFPVCRKNTGKRSPPKVHRKRSDSLVHCAFY